MVQVKQSLLRWGVKMLCFLVGHKISYPYAQNDPCTRCGHKFYKVREPFGGL